MAIEAERLVAVLEARFTEFEKAVDRAQQKFAGTSAAIEQRGDALAANITRSAARGASGLERLSKATRDTQVNTGSLTAQFQDIAVQLAGGQSPFLIALQQGTQVTQAFGNSGVRGAIAGVGGALLGLINPVSLVTLGLIAAGGAALQYFMSSENGGAQTEDSLRRQGQLIDDVVQKYGDALPKLRAYREEQARAVEASNLTAAAEGPAQAEAKKIEDVLATINREYSAAMQDLRSYGDDTKTVVADLASAFSSLQTKIQDGKATTEDLTSAQNALQAALDNYGKPSVIEFGNAFAGILPQIQAAISAVSDFRAEAANAVGGLSFDKAIKNSTLPQLDPLGFINEERDRQARANATRSQYEIEQERLARSASRGGGEKTNSYESATESVKERIATLTAETDALSQLNPLVEDYGYAQEKARTEADLLSSAQKAGLAITPELRAEIAQLADGYASATVASKQLAEQSQKTKAAMAFAKDLTSGALSDMRSALEDGKISWQEFGDMAINVLNKIADKAQDALVDALFSGASGTGGFSLLSLFGLGSSASTVATSGGGVFSATGAAASSARVASGLPSDLVSSASVNRLGAASLKPTSQRVDVSVGVDMDSDGNWKSHVKNVARSAAAPVVRDGINLYRKHQFHDDVARHAARPRVRGK
ncbi:hypothetical protein M2360_000930 [Rhizobium sp. SG_E_25_P2]|uniref:phage tail length tape measure family protein n=1 Tax=Rhizobium sp. SG_E_25_P2 TaxID=2879942 RepID=UPI0024760F27|nr:phage tail length tape measure family protein [Rhizobium sp. SG_E_25_P2]MDH6265540.1 hypothetical protein [Rhizobium sp. SG_E_25_P2]